MQVLLCQSHPAVAGLTRASKWGVVVVAQFLGLASSIIVLLWPEISAVIAARALHGVAAAGYLVYCLSLLVELSPKQHLATGIAAMAAGEGRFDNGNHPHSVHCSERYLTAKAVIECCQCMRQALSAATACTFVTSPALPMTAYQVTAYHAQPLF